MPSDISESERMHQRKERWTREQRELQYSSGTSSLVHFYSAIGRQKAHTVDRVAAHLVVFIRHGLRKQGIEVEEGGGMASNTIHQLQGHVMSCM